MHCNAEVVDDALIGLDLAPSKAFLDLLLDLEHERRRSGLKARHAM
jgi:hypothetical protein